MRKPTFFLLIGSTAFLSACSASPGALSQTTAPAAAWPTPQQAESTGPVDGVAGRLTTWLQLVGPNSSGIPARTYADFLATRPVWPHWAVIQARYEHALTSETDSSVVADLCRSQPPKSAPALSRCVTVSGDSSTLTNAGRAAWRDGNDGDPDAATLQSLFGAALTQSDDWARFEREERKGRLPAAARTITTLDADHAALANARMAFRRNDASAEAALASVPQSLASDPVLLLDHAHWLEKNTRFDDALNLWKQSGFTIERGVPQDMRGRFWTERDRLARDLLDQGRAADALMMADDHGQTTDRNRADATFLSGWIALRALHDPASAEPHFRELTEIHSVLNRAAGFYWLGRARADAGDAASASANWQRAAEAPETFYGQMAIAKLSNAGNTLLAPSAVPDALATALRQWRVAGSRNEHEPTAVITRLDGSDLARAAQILASWNDPSHAREFLTMLLAQDNVPQDREAIAALATRLGLADVGVAAARKAAKDGVTMPDYGWPDPFQPPSSDLPYGVVQALMRQESNFNPDAVSSSNAIGLMQLLPATAQETARQTGAGSVTITALHQPELNMQLGTAYLSKVYNRLGNVVEYAAAGYNAGPHRVSQWLETRGDPARTGADQDAMIDWIEQIPLEEPRSYVKRVWESIAVYATRRQG
ncbi:lytic transglycosylase domain-containing protein [Acetobacter conturbans]|uniref:Transglycosylase SLT domain-containing protein n=1 Tax=Acetobacter conturbans TaxID=1737472 RepID=A0ABX0K1S8_9PROT|nr:lytic transglycosylase domain-containing protein [Acetobacter conturbans]NHN87669.1 transglycosylase SLT domain-containing protein [Acetobacter conturbans]